MKQLLKPPSKSFGLWLIITGFILLMITPLYEFFISQDIPIIVKVGLGILLVGIIFIIIKQLKERKQDKVKIQ